jgi:hypothetical protein
MQGTCPRCGDSRPVPVEGAGLACGACGHGAIVISGAPPAQEPVIEPLWAPALVLCMGVSCMVFVAALLAARIATASVIEVSPSATGDACSLNEAPRSELCTSEASAAW